MMSFDPSPAPGLSPATLDALRTTLGRSVRTGNHGTELRGLLCDVAKDAHDKGMRAEQLLVTLKAVWYALPEVVGSARGDAAPVLLQELISRCIEEYYTEK
jgi:hypothetical protein